MSFKITKSGKRGVRLKKALYDILEQYPEGLPANALMQKVKEGNAKKFVSSTSQIAQTLRSMKGVIREDGYCRDSVGVKYKASVYILKYPEDFIEWFHDLPVGSV
tara:strand:+ start:147 stop:461 length:315 start_codon:yes stop_codon:yes gene_type:complete